MSIYLPASEAAVVQRSVSARRAEFGARMLDSGEGAAAGRRVMCLLTPKHLVVKEYVLKVIPKTVATFRLCPSTKVKYHWLQLNTILLGHYMNKTLTLINIKCKAITPFLEMIGKCRELLKFLKMANSLFY